jgi:hypothetical protein
VSTYEAVIAQVVAGASTEDLRADLAEFEASASAQAGAPATTYIKIARAELARRDQENGTGT